MIPEFHRASSVLMHKNGIFVCVGADWPLVEMHPTTSLDGHNLAIGHRVQGRLRNLLPHAECFKDEGGKRVPWSRGNSRLAPDLPAWTHSWQAGRGVISAEATGVSLPPHSGVTFSIFLWSEQEPVLRVSLTNGFESVAVEWSLSKTPERYDLSHRFLEATDNITVAIAIKDAPASGALEWELPVLEDGGFSSTPIAIGQTREVETLAYPQKEWDLLRGHQGTAILTFIPMWHAASLNAETRPHLLYAGGEGSPDDYFALYVDPRKGGRLVAHFRHAGYDASLVSDVVPVRDNIYTAAVRWFGGFADLFVNGWPVAGSGLAEFPSPDRLESLFIGCRPGAASYSSFSLIPRVEIFGEWLHEKSLISHTYAQAPANLGHLEPLLLAPSSSSRLEHFAKDNVWSNQIVGMLLRYPHVWQQCRPAFMSGMSIDEGNFRDQVYQTLMGAAVSCQREEHSDAGRTDLLVGSSVALDDGQCLRVEFKVWGRHDYAEVPNKPLKYMLSGEPVGAVLMINPNIQKNIGDDYRENVRKNSTGFAGIVDFPYGVTSTLPDHFVSIHQTETGDRAEVLHIVFDKHRPFEEP